MKFDILNRFTGAVQFTAEIDCNKDESISIKIGLAVKWAVKNKADLRFANLRSADLSSADLSSADLSFANLRFADLSSANLRSADLSSADLSSANLSSANLRSADLSSADLSSADLRFANLRSADLRFINSADGKILACMNAGKYQVVLSKDKIAIGCQFHEIEVWRSFSDEKISKMDDGALEWWNKWKELVFAFHNNVFG